MKIKVVYWSRFGRKRTKIFASYAEAFAFAANGRGIVVG